MRLRHALAFAVLALAGSAVGEDLNLISAVEVKDEGAFVVLSVTGSKPPNFTTFSMADPPRFVIDFSEAKFQGVPEDVSANSTLIRAVKNLSYGSDATSIARILVAFTVDVDPPEVQAQGTSLVVRIERPAGAAGTMVAQADEAAQRAREEAEAQARAEAQRRADEAAEAQARAEAQRRAGEEAEAQARAEAQRQADEAAAAAAALAAKAADAAELRAREERQAQEAAEALARDELDAALKGGDEARQAAERKAQEEAERLEALAAAKADADRRKREEEAEARRQREEAIAAAQAEAESRKLEEAERRAEARRQRDEERLALAEARAAQVQPRDDALEAGAPSTQLREIGFRQMPGISRVFVRTSVPARFSIQDVSENMIRVELENTRVMRRNDARFLDTSFFPSAVALITPSRRGSSYVVDIKLKQRVPYQQKIEGDMLAIDFERPAGDAAAPAPGAGPRLDQGDPAIR